MNISTAFSTDADVNKDMLHPIFTKDPNEWVRLVNNQVRVRTEDDRDHIGFVYTVDPVSESIVLVTDLNKIDSNKIAMKLLMGPSVRSVEVISEGNKEICQCFDNLFRPAVAEKLNPEALAVRMQRLKLWLEKHRLPVSISGSDGQSLTIADALTVCPPYTEHSCLSTNEIILARIQELIRTMPNDMDGNV